MFWSSLATTSSAVDSALDQPDVTLESILELDEVLQELRAGNRKLSEFLLRSENLHAMLDLITVPPQDTVPVGKQYKFPNIACELLTSDVLFGEKIAADRSALEKMFNFFKNSSAPLNPILASYVCRVISDIVTRKHDQNWYSYQLNIIQLLGFLTENGANILDWILLHIGTSAVCDLTYKLIMNLEGPDMKANLLDWLQRHNFVDRLFAKMGNNDVAIHEGVHRLVVDLLAAFRDEMSSNSESDSLHTALKSAAAIKALLGVILDTSDRSHSSIIFGLNITVALIGISEPAERPQLKAWAPALENMENVILDVEITVILLTRFKDLANLLKLEPSDTLNLASGVVVERVGSMRLAIIKFFAHISSLRKSEFLDEMVKLNILQDILKIFWSNTTNGFMHRAVEKIIVNILYTQEKNLALPFLFLQENLLKKLPLEFETLDHKVTNRGILARIATVASNVTVGSGFQTDTYGEFTSKFPAVSDEWEIFVYENLDTYLKKQRTHLGGVLAPAPGATIQSPEDLIPSSENNMWNMVTRSNDFDDLSNNVEFDVFSSTDRFDDTRSKSMFEMFCSERSNGVTEDDDINIGLPEEDKFETCPELA